MTSPCVRCRDGRFAEGEMTSPHVCAAGTGPFAEGEMTVPGAVGDAKGQIAVFAFLSGMLSMPILAVLRLGLAYFCSGSLEWKPNFTS